jgi:SAM-dependent methyltransferase
MMKYVGLVQRLRRRLGLGDAIAHSSEASERDSEYYDKVYQGVDELEDLRAPYWRSYYYFLWAVILDRLRRAGVRQVLEAGCGPGRLAELLVEHGLSYVGFDFSRTAIEMARQRLPQFQFEQQDARTSKLFQSVKHDAVICTEVLEHIQDDLSVVSNFQVGKRCLCTVPNFPYESHVRHFLDAESVARRYSEWFVDFDVLTLQSPNSPSAKFFLFEGIRNERQWSPHVIEGRVYS